MHARGEVTQLLAELTHGGRDAVDRLYPLVYAELQRVAHRQLAGERPDHTLATTELVHEAYLKLVGLERIEWRNRAHFFAVAARAMRRILVDYAVSRGAQKRGGGGQRVALDAVELVADERGEDLLALDDALVRLEAIQERCARVVECRFFGGMSIEETAEALDVSPATVKRDWTVARAWLYRELSA
ncbi:MAG TPA: sigma-70 family RNA polymerase sigma factor [Longimicrobiaceae bacterium]|nr:sigma-70 family RNA polymerase sigma factor [Longimicrobiaceae bacterium]